MTTAEHETEPQSEMARGNRLPGCISLGCFGRLLLIAAALAGIIVIIGETFDQGEDAAQPSRGFNAGVAEEYARGDLTYFDTRHVFVVRLEDGEFIALYDQSPKQQELHTGCRVRFDERAQLLGLAQLPGFEGAFVEECEGTTTRTTWRADGAFVSGAGYGDLDRFETRREDDGTLFVETDRRTCTRSRGVIGVPPFETRTCRGAD